MLSRPLRAIAKVVAVAAVTAAAIQGYHTFTDYLEKRKREKAATAIQKWFRNNLYCNYNIQKKTQCAVRIQQWWKKIKTNEKSTRVCFTREKWNELVKLVMEDIACTMIQTWWKAKKKIGVVLGWEVELPTTVRFRRLEKRIAAVIIQSWWKMIRQKRLYQEMKARQLQSNLLPQDYKDATIKIQSHMRMRTQRQIYLTEQVNALKVVSQTRGYLARRQMDELMDSLEKEIATTIIQSWWKMNSKKRWFSTHKGKLNEQEL